MQAPRVVVDAKRAVEQDFLKRPGVRGVGVGFKYVNGRRTDEIAVQVFVEEKRDVPAEETIPRNLDGIPTDVIARRVVPQGLSIRVEDLRVQADTGRYDPLQGGISIGPCRAVGGFIHAGTLGAVVRDNATGDHMLLSNFHVLCIDNTWAVGDTMAQPSRVDTGVCPADVVGQLQRGVLGGEVDCAIASRTARSSICEITEIGPVAGAATAVLGSAVRKRGRTTGLTFGTVDSVNLTVIVPYGGAIGDITFTNQIGVAVDTAQSTVFSQSGDSGSVVVDGSRNILGLHFAGTEDGSFGVANIIQAVLAALNISLCVPAPKSILKDFKDTHKEKRELKERKLEKIELKERKLEKVELKEQKREKVEVKELKEAAKELKELKEFKPEYEKGPGGEKPPKEIVEGGGPKLSDARPPFGTAAVRGVGETTTIEERLGFVERAVTEMAHFIVAGMRPDLMEGALKEEGDLLALSQRLEREAADAKHAKDGKDMEKPSER